MLGAAFKQTALFIFAPNRSSRTENIIKPFPPLVPIKLMLLFFKNFHFYFSIVNQTIHFLDLLPPSLKVVGVCCSLMHHYAVKLFIWSLAELFCPGAHFIS